MDLNTPNSTASYLVSLQQFDAPCSFEEQGQSSSATITHNEYTDTEQQHHHHEGGPVTQERRNLRCNRCPPSCGTGHHLGH